MKHPFLDTTYAIAWSVLTPEHIEPDIEKALSLAQANIEDIANQPRSELTFESTLLAFENATEVLQQAWGKVTHLDSVANNPELRKAHNALLPKVSDFYTRLFLNQGLWQVIKAYSESQEAQTLSGVRKRFLEEILQDFRESGADLPQEKQSRLAAINAELAQCTQKFSENVLDATNAWELVIDDVSRLAGLPESALAAAQQDAFKKGYGSEEKPQWRFTLHAPSLIPALTYLEDRSLRETLWRASSEVGAKDPYDNTVLIERILALRHEKAQLLGFDHFADYTTGRRMAKSGRAALEFTEAMHQRCVDAFRKEIEQLCTFREHACGEPKATLQPWDFGYWSERQRKACYDFDEEDLRPYFSIDKVIEGLFTLAETVFGVRIQEVNGMETWHEEVKYYTMHDREGRHMGSFYADWHPRESKRGGAWMNHFKTGTWAKEGNWQPHLGLICGNLTPSVGKKPALLTHREVETIFHEFGHLLHHLAGEVEIRSLNGIHVVWDFVELPSQMMENWCWERESLDLFARHYETDAPIPEDLFKKMLAAKNYQSALAVMRQLALGKMDLELHLQPQNFAEKDLESVIQEFLADYSIPYATQPRSMARRFTHLFADSTGYAGGYYSYKWAEVLDADAFTRFKNEGILNPQVGMDFRNKILACGNSVPADQLFRDFMGRDPDLNSLLTRCGIQ